MFIECYRVSVNDWSKKDDELKKDENKNIAHFFHLFIPYVFLYLNLFLCHLIKLIFYIVYVYLNNFQLS